MEKNYYKPKSPRRNCQGDQQTGIKVRVKMPNSKTEKISLPTVVMHYYYTTIF